MNNYGRNFISRWTVFRTGRLKDLIFAVLFKKRLQGGVRCVSAQKKIRKLVLRNGKKQGFFFVVHFQRQIMVFADKTQSVLDGAGVEHCHAFDFNALAKIAVEREIYLGVHGVLFLVAKRAEKQKQAKSEKVNLRFACT